MDQKSLIKNLHQLFCDEHRSEKKYSKVWLSDVDFGGLYQSNKYVLNVLAEHDVDNCNSEIIEVLDLLQDKAKAELEYIQRVIVHHSDDPDAYCSSDDIVVFEEENVCN